jgi:hypothetical protein
LTFSASRGEKKKEGKCLLWISHIFLQKSFWGGEGDSFRHKRKQKKEKASKSLPFPKNEANSWELMLKTCGFLRFDSIFVCFFRFLRSTYAYTPHARKRKILL